MTIEQKESKQLLVSSTLLSSLYIAQGDDDIIELDTHGAKQLIRVLQEFVNENQD